MGELDPTPESSTNDVNVAKPSDGPGEPSSVPAEDDLEFKKPALDAHMMTKKTILQKYMRQRKGFVKGGTLTSVSTESESAPPAETVPEKKNSAPAPPPPPLKYDEPDWAEEPPDDYFLEEVKSGVIEKRIPLKSKTFFTFGRLEICDIPMAHPTVSRYHAVLQYRGTPEGEDDCGFYLYDLGSTHGTCVNKYKIKSRVYGRIRVGHMIKIGGSSRFFILQGPDDDVEEESSLSFTEMKQKRQQELLERKLQEEKEKEEEELERERQERLIEERGISWGMDEDADEETDLSVNPYASVTNEELYIDDPKKALRLWFEREGEELDYQIEKAERGMFACKLVLPVDAEDGSPTVTIETSGKNKKEAQVQCALDACRALDKLGVFRPSKRESKKAKKRNWEENDYYDSDEDSFFDRTGDLEKKRQRRMEKAGKVAESVETYESLQEKYSQVIDQLGKAEKAHSRLLAKAARAQEGGSEEVDELDAFMANLKKAAPSKSEMKAAEMEVEKLKKEEIRLRHLVNIAKPATLPELAPPPPPVESQPEPIRPPDTSEPSQSNNPNKLPAQKTKGPSFQPPESANPKATSALPAKPQKSQKKKSKIRTPKIAEDDFEDLVWRPPQGQTGDGRTSLNDKLGY